MKIVKSPAQLGPLEHTDHCDRPGMIWHGPIGGLPVRGYCPGCGASEIRRPTDTTGQDG